MYNFIYFKDDGGIRKPWFVENSKVPVILSYVAPIDINAIAFGPFVWSRGVMDEQLKNHETIHYHQQLELLFVGQWLLYVFYWLKGLITYKDGAVAYVESPFEREAYANDANLDYLKGRERFAWRKYI
jgi:hypothetical protein|tara:strand:- start:2652 stop:3035 length:384 start_codon:yes stop_codon:yes gene_type:complete